MESKLPLPLEVVYWHPSETGAETQAVKTQAIQSAQAEADAAKRAADRRRRVDIAASMGAIII